MARVLILEATLFAATLWLIGWGLVKLYYLVRREASFDHIETRRVKREAEDALNDLEHAVERATTKRRRTGSANKRP